MYLLEKHIKQVKENEKSKQKTIIVNKAHNDQILIKDAPGTHLRN